jgi:hypothetical protein
MASSSASTLSPGPRRRPPIVSMASQAMPRADAELGASVAEDIEARAARSGRVERRPTPRQLGPHFWVARLIGALPMKAGAVQSV